MLRALVHFHQGPIIVDKTGQALWEKYPKRFSDVFVHLASVKYVLYVIPQSFMTCGRSVKEKEFSLISYCIIYLYHSLVTSSQISCSQITRSLIPQFPITCYRTLTTRLITPLDPSLSTTHLVPSLLLSNLLPDNLVAPTKPVLVKLDTPPPPLLSISIYLTCVIHSRLYGKIYTNKTSETTRMQLLDYHGLAGRRLVNC